MIRLAVGGLVLGLLAAVGGAASTGTPASVADATLAADVTAGPGSSARATATWCGAAASADRAPNVVAGKPAHWVYAIPSDGEDRLATLAPVMQGDAEQIDAWWRVQDSARALRNDLAQFPCGVQLDITTVRIARTGAQLTTLEGRFGAIAEAMSAPGLGSATTKYVVYYDGPVGGENVCGQGGSDGSGFGVAAVYLRSCLGVSTAAVAAHEVLHTLGAVSRSAPNVCSDSAHTCDDPNDLMHPTIDDQPLAAKALDAGRNDYYGHGGTWTDTQDSPWLVQLDNQAPFSLTITGPGSVIADVPGLLCAASCTTTWNAGTSIALTATPGTGAKLVRWTGSCSGSTGCFVTVGPGTSAAAFFAPATFPLSVAVSGRGSVRSRPGRISCRPRCSVVVPSYEPVTLMALPAKGWKLRTWSGACRGTKKSCTVPMSAATKARATFVRA